MSNIVFNYSDLLDTRIHNAYRGRLWPNKKKYVDHFNDKNIQEIGKLMNDEFHLTDGEVIKLALKQALLTYSDRA